MGRDDCWSEAISSGAATLKERVTADTDWWLPGSNQRGSRDVSRSTKEAKILVFTTPKSGRLVHPQAQC